MFSHLCAGHCVQKDPVRDGIESFTEIQRDCLIKLPLLFELPYHSSFAMQIHSFIFLNILFVLEHRDQGLL